MSLFLIHNMEIIIYDAFRDKETPEEDVDTVEKEEKTSYKDVELNVETEKVLLTCFQHCNQMI